MSFELNYEGGAEVLKKMAAPEIDALARKVVAAAGPHAELDEYNTDRAAASVRVPAALQAKDGVLTRAATAAGLEVRLK